MLDRVADQRELHTRRSGSISRSKKRKTRVIGKVLALDRLGKNRVEPAELAAQDVGKELVAHDGDLSPAQVAGSASARRKPKGSGFERVGKARPPASCAASALTRSEKLFESIAIRKPRSRARATHSRCSWASSVSRKPSKRVIEIDDEAPNAGRLELFVRDVVKPRRKAVRSEHGICLVPVIPGILGSVHTPSTRLLWRRPYPPIWPDSHRRCTRISTPTPISCGERRNVAQ